MIMYILLVSVGAGIGAVMRLLLSSSISAALGAHFPYGTLVVNVSGSMVIGMFYIFFSDKPLFDEVWKPLLFIGMLGGFTTFSAFAYETLRLLENGNLVLGFVNVVSNVFFCVGGCWLGCQAAKFLIR